MQCEQVEIHLAALLFDELDPAIKPVVLGHLEGCKACSERLGDMRVAAGLLGEAVRTGPEPTLDPRRRAALLTAASGAKSMRSRPAWFEPLPLRLPFRRVLFAPVPGAKALAKIAAVLTVLLCLAGLLLPALNAPRRSSRLMMGDVPLRDLQQGMAPNAQTPAAVVPTPAESAKESFGHLPLSRSNRTEDRLAIPTPDQPLSMSDAWRENDSKQIAENSRLSSESSPGFGGTDSFNQSAPADELRASLRTREGQAELGLSTNSTIDVKAQFAEKSAYPATPAPTSGDGGGGGRASALVNGPVDSGSADRMLRRQRLMGAGDIALGTDTKTSAAAPPATLSGGTFNLQSSGFESTFYATASSGGKELKGDAKLRAGDREVTGQGESSARATTPPVVEAIRKLKAGEGLVLNYHEKLEESDLRRDLLIAHSSTTKSNASLEKDSGSITKSGAGVLSLPSKDKDYDGTGAFAGGDMEVASGKQDNSLDSDAKAFIELPEIPLTPAANFKAGPVNPWVLTRQDRFSTFALDVDTASYAIARSYIHRGYRPPPASIRMEEFVNAFDYNYPRQSGDTFSVHPEAAPSPFAQAGAGLTLLKIGVQARVLGREGRKAAHLTFVIDTSGSMARPDRLPLVQRAIEMLVGQLSDADRVSVVTFGPTASLVVQAVPACDRKTILDAVGAIRCQGSTNLVEGLRLGYATAARGFLAGQINRVILCSDGVANIGQTEAQQVLQAVAAYRRNGVTFTSAGFGMGAYNDDLLEKLADQGDGQYVYVDSPEQAKHVFVDQMGAALQAVAKDAKIQVEFNPARVRRYRLIGYENRAIADADFRNDAVVAGAVGSGQSSTALYELELTPTEEGMPPADLGTVFVRYRNVDTDKVEEISRRLEAAVVRPRTASDSPRFFLAAAVAQLAEVLRGSEHARSGGGNETGGESGGEAGGGNLVRVEGVLRQVAMQIPLDAQVREAVELVQRVSKLPTAP